MLNRRHYLAELEPSAREALVPALLEGLPHTMRDEATENAVLKAFLEERIPGIVCRPTRVCREGQGQLGFSFPIRIEEQRVRSSLIVSGDQVSGFVSPYEVMDRAVSEFPPVHPALRFISGHGERFGVRLGLIGSAALAAVTGLAYVRPASDLDILVDAEHGGDIEAFYRAVTSLCGELGISVDAELEVDISTGVKLSEYLSRSKTVLVKKIDGVDLVDRDKLSVFSAVSMLEKDRSNGVSGERTIFPAMSTI
ncbi:phosphoribosyl-dephospho-CoA transferase [Breoghania corrubedonensis]|uniref:Phosphoribosyl-dephospho-CoA transferase n=1 Tax=Breoghania corrubedonensis TaxID=665038 RepID=A0A2T5V9G9_9HYPH|nr:malonate decarboxylase holo-[acyl-carrier-protein] synthase [Breoghania corrubedonensis]PTW60405.1 phosphoribosyl-dephospho-CoA transferase [Breoghania corrubedonensis]